MANLKTDYKDDILDSTQNIRRKFRMITNDDGTFSFEDVTDYLQYGDSFGALDLNAITNAIMNECLKRTDVVDNAESTATDVPLSANMGRELIIKISNIATYSIEEQEIGSWIDGKKLYRKILHADTTNFTYVGSSYVYDLPIGETIDTIFVEFGTAFDTLNNLALTLPFMAAVAANQIRFEIHNNNTIRVASGVNYGTRITNLNVCVIYTKANV